MVSLVGGLSSSLLAFAQTCNDVDLDNELTNKNTCKCSETLHCNISGALTCIDCGASVAGVTQFEETSYSRSSNCHQGSGFRVRTRVQVDKKGLSDALNFDCGERIYDITSRLYAEVTHGEIFRGNSRKSIVFACTFHAYKMIGKHQTYDSLITRFGITRKAGLKGLKLFNLNISKELLNTQSITPMNLVEDIVALFSAPPSCLQEIELLYQKICVKFPSTIERLRPQSVACALVYLWMQQSKIDVTLRDFAQKVDMSEITIAKTINLWKEK